MVVEWILQTFYFDQSPLFNKIRFYTKNTNEKHYVSKDIFANGVTRNIFYEISYGPINQGPIVYDSREEMSVIGFSGATKIFVIDRFPYRFSTSSLRYLCSKFFLNLIAVEKIQDSQTKIYQINSNLHASTGNIPQIIYQEIITGVYNQEDVNYTN
jgi:hypothetical protein